MTDKKYADIASKKRDLIRKALDGSAFIADYSADAITTITADSSGDPGVPTLKVLPAGYSDLGLLTADGAAFSNAITNSDVSSWGRIEPSRRDIVGDVDSIHVIAQETKLATIAAYTGVAASVVDAADGTTGEVSVTKPASPTVVYHRMFCIAVDAPGSAEEIYIARFYPNIALESKGDQVFMSGDTPVQWDTTWTAFTDPVLGYSLRYIFGGPGWQALLTEMGFS